MDGSLTKEKVAMTKRLLGVLATVALATVQNVKLPKPQMDPPLRPKQNPHLPKEGIGDPF